MILPMNLQSAGKVQNKNDEQQDDKAAAGTDKKPINGMVSIQRFNY